MARRGWWLVVLACLAGGPAFPKEVVMKSHGVFYTEPMRQQAARNVARWPWAAESTSRTCLRCPVMRLPAALSCRTPEVVGLSIRCHRLFLTANENYSRIR